MWVCLHCQPVDWFHSVKSDGQPILEPCTGQNRSISPGPRLEECGMWIQPRPGNNLFEYLENYASINPTFLRANHFTLIRTHGSSRFIISRERTRKTFLFFSLLSFSFASHTSRLGLAPIRNAPPSPRSPRLDFPGRERKPVHRDRAYDRGIGSLVSRG